MIRKYICTYSLSHYPEFYFISSATVLAFRTQCCDYKLSMYTNAFHSSFTRYLAHCGILISVHFLVEWSTFHCRTQTFFKLQIKIPFAFQKFGFNLQCICIYNPFRSFMLGLFALLIIANPQALILSAT